MNNQDNKQCNIGILGAGRIGKLHAQNIRLHLPQCKIIAISDPLIDNEWATSLQIPVITRNNEDVFNHAEIDAILIASPSHLHSAQIKAASNAGKAIFCEKPAGLPEDDIEDILKLVDRNNTLLQLGFNRRFDCSFANIKERITAGEIGNPQIIRITSRDPACPPTSYCATSGGIFMDMTIHDFDMARFLTGSEVVEVYASGAVLINPDFEACHDVDTAIVQMRFANGALGVIDNSRQAVYGYDQRVEVFGSKGMLLAQNQLNNTVKSFSGTATTTANPKYFFLERYQQAFIAEMQSFYQAWLNKTPPLVSGWDAFYAMRIAKAAKLSMQTRLPVEITHG